jgi:hypothetical protein
MLISPFFLDLRAAYQSELDDLRLDSEGKDVLRRRLADKRKEIGFLVQMMTLSPEMVAVVFHQAFRFTTPAALDDLLGREAEDFPEWEQLVMNLELAPWAQPLVSEVLKQPMGDWFMAVAAGLEYVAGKPALDGSSRDDSDNDNDSDDPNGDNLEDEFDDEEHEGDGGAQGDAKSRKEAADDWMAEQGFDRKE